MTASQPNEGDYYSQYTSGDVTYTEITKPFYFHFVAMASYYPSMDWEYDEILAKCSIYIASYNTLKNKTSKTDEENTLCSDLKKYLNKYEQRARSEQSLINPSIFKNNKTIVSMSYRL